MAAVCKGGGLPGEGSPKGAPQRRAAPPACGAATGRHDVEFLDEAMALQPGAMALHGAAAGTGAKAIRPPRGHIHLHGLFHMS